MSLMELLPSVQALPRREKFRLMQELLTELAQEEEIIPAGEYPLWSPIEAYDAAAVLMKMLEQEKRGKAETA